MQPCLKPALCLVALCLLPADARSDMGDAREMLQDGAFEEALAELQPAAQSGNADAEDMIGAMYALGLGVSQDHKRAFEWYLRAAMKGHAAAQSSVGWYFENGFGHAQPDALRAYVWYRLSGIGGHAEAAASWQAIAHKLSSEDVDHGEKLIEDYKSWLYPLQ